MADNVVPLNAAQPKTDLPRSFKFTQTSLKSATRAYDAAGATNVILRDTEARGLIVRKQRRDWVVGIERRIRNKVWRVTIGPYAEDINVAAIRAEVQQIIGEIIAGTYTTQAQRNEARGKGDDLTLMTVDQAVDLHARVNPELRASTIRSYRSAVGYLTNGKPVRMIDVTTDYVRTAYARLLTTHSPATANQMLRSVKAIWQTWADEHPEDTAPTRNPVTPITRKKKGTVRRSQPRTGALLPSERRPWIDAVLAEMKGRGPTGTAHAALAMLFLTGLRLNEACGLRWDDVTATEITINEDRMKGGTALVRPITPMMQRILDHQRLFHPDSPWCFPARVGAGHMSDVRKAMDPINEAIAGRRLTAHDLRRTYLATAEVAGVPAIAQKMLIGHTTSDVTQDYLRSLAPQLPQFGQTIEAALMGAEQ
ncbi:MAG: tyrosine-type recombinase/integrase [Roseovarius sp.]